MEAKAWQTKNGMGTADAVLSVLAAGDPLGYTADELAHELGLPSSGSALQHDLEAMVEQGILDRRGIGRGALYTLLLPVPAIVARPGHPGGLALKAPLAHKAG